MVVPAIHAALPVLFMSFFVTSMASVATSLPRDDTMETMVDSLSFEIMLLSTLGLFFMGTRLSGKETPPFRGWEAMETWKELVDEEGTE